MAPAPLQSGVGFFLHFSVFLQSKRKRKNILCMHHGRKTFWLPHAQYSAAICHVQVRFTGILYTAALFILSAMYKRTVRV
jgi:hypothetical protein